MQNMHVSSKSEQSEPMNFKPDLLATLIHSISHIVMRNWQSPYLYGQVMVRWFM